MSHSHAHKANSLHVQQRKLRFTILLNILITVAQVLGGLYSGSLSLLSDALHNLSDVISLVISYIASILTRKEQTVKRTFGYKRAEIIAAFVNTLILIIVAVFLAIEAIKRFQNPHEIGSFWVITLSILAIAINGISTILLHHDSRYNLNIRSAYLHLLSDTITSMAVLIAGILMYFYKIYWVDGVLTLLISVYLIFISLKLFIESLKVLMLFTPSQIIIEHINARVCSIQKVQNLHHVHVWQLDNDQICFEGHLDLTEDLPLLKVNAILDEIREILHKEFNIDHVTLQPEFNLCDTKDLISKEH